LAINKMDLTDYDQQIFETINTDFLSLATPLGFSSITAIPISALKGDNITARSAHTPWYQGPTLMGCLETIEVSETTNSKAAFPVQWVNRPNANFRGFSGTLASGQLTVGDEIRVTSSGQTALLSQIVTADGNPVTARAGDAITLTLDREIDASRGD